jgi:cysteine synthase A
MKNKLNKIKELIGNTELVFLKNISEKYGQGNKIYAKIESDNPTHSVKDRPALYMLLAAFEAGKLNDSTVIIEPTSGNTGISLAYIGQQLGLRVILTMPETMSVERRQLMASFGAELVLTEGAKGMKGAIAKSAELHEEIQNSIIPMQFENIANPRSHYETTGPELLKALPEIDVLVGGVGTGGTITGAGKYLKEHKDVTTVAVEPFESSVLSGLPVGPHKIQGIGAGFIPAVLDLNVVNSIQRVTTTDAIETAKELFATDNVSAGISAGAALKGAIQYIQEAKLSQKNIVFILPDNKDKYISMGL